MAGTMMPGVTGAIADNELYTLAEIRERLGLGTYALRQARRQGLRVYRIGRRAYVLGFDVLEFVKRKEGVGNE